MRKLAIVVMVFGIIFGLKYNDNGLLKIGLEGQYTEYDNSFNVVYSGEKPLLRASNGYSRLDIDYGINVVDTIIADLDATIVRAEIVDDIIITYAYTDKIYGYRVVGDSKINVMIAENGVKVVVGSPIILGSY